MVDPFLLGGALLAGAAAGALVGAGVAYATSPRVYYYLPQYVAYPAYPYYYGPPPAWYYPRPYYWLPPAYPYYYW